MVIPLLPQVSLRSYWGYLEVILQPGRHIIPAVEHQPGAVRAHQLMGEVDIKEKTLRVELVHPEAGTVERDVGFIEGIRPVWGLIVIPGGYLNADILIGDAAHLLYYQWYLVNWDMLHCLEGNHGGELPVLERGTPSYITDGDLTLYLR
ncbi:hypothetical protein ES703_86794 [subsurface metagenome]